MSGSTPSGGRRAAPRRRPAVGGTALAGVLVALAATSLAGLAQLVEPAARQSPVGDTVPVDRTTGACVEGAARSQVTSVAAALPGTRADAGGDGGNGSLSLAVGDSAPRVVSTKPGAVTEVADEAAAAPMLVVDARGGAAVGRASARLDRESSTLAWQECAEPRARWWFTGAGASTDHSSDVVLANLDPGPAVLDLVVHGPAGEVEGVGTRGLTLAPGEVRRLPLVESVTPAEELAIEVRTSRGRVVAAVEDRWSARTAAAEGREWVPAQTEPSRRVVLAPVSQRADRRTLVVANPTGREALAEIEVSGETGSFAPTGTETLRVPPGSVVTTDLTQAVGRDASAVRLRSAVPLTATLRSVRGGDVSYAGAVEPLTGPAVSLLPDDVEAAVQLTSPGGAASVALRAYTTDGSELDRARLRIDAGATAAWSPPGRAAYVVVEPGKGSVLGGTVLTSGSGVTQAILRPVPVEVSRPAVLATVR